MKKFLTLILAGVLAFASCKNTETLLPNVSGKAGEVIVVMDRENWEGALGNSTRALLADECPFLVQREPLFNLVNVAPTGFADLFKIHRNIVIFNINPQNDTTGLVHKRNVWANTQVVLQISAYDSEGAIKLLEENGKTIVNAIEQAERDRIIGNNLRYEERGIAPQVAEVFGGYLHFPSGYKVRKVTPDFMWIADEKQYVYQDVLIYRYPAEKDHPFTSDNIIRHRNEALQANVPGMFENTYMTTSDFFTPQIEYMRYRGRHFVQTRGMWDVKNDFMGGPFVSHSFYSRDGQDIIVVEAFVYAPRYDKRQYLRQVESILYSWEWAVQLIGFGTFETKERKARQGRNPRQPEEIIEIAASKAPTFKAGKALKDAVNK